MPGTMSARQLWITAISYVGLVALTLSRPLGRPAVLRPDLADPRRGFFTFVAGTEVLDSELALAGHRQIALALLVGGASHGSSAASCRGRRCLAEPTGR